jgi:TetR/AcrR family transcriptional regulator, ethionamide resistance regulator
MRSGDPSSESTVEQPQPSKTPRGAGRRRHGSTPSRGEQRRESLLDSAEELLSTSSAADLTIEEVASTTGLSRSSVYFYFANKTELVDALITRASDEMLSSTVARTYGEPLEAFIARVVLSALEGWRTHRVVFLAAAEVSSHANEGTSRWRSIMSEFADRIAEALRFDVPSPDLDHEVTLYSELVCWTIERNFYMLFARDHRPEDETALAEALIRSTLSVLDSVTAR